MNILYYVFKICSAKHRCTTGFFNIPPHRPSHRQHHPHYLKVFFPIYFCYDTRRACQHVQHLVSRVVTRAYAQELAPWALYGLILYLGDQDYLPSEVVQPAGGIKDESYQPNELVKKVEKGHELREFIVTYIRNVNF